MPRFFNAKDLDFIRTISEEVVDYVVEQAIVLFKVSVGETKTNLYGESLGKVWHAPATLMCIVDREPTNVVYAVFTESWEWDNKPVLDSLFYEETDANLYAEELRNKVYPELISRDINPKVHYNVIVKEKNIK